MNRNLDSVILRYVGYASVFMGVLFLLYLVRGTVPVFLLALMLAYAFEPLLQGLERRGYSRRAAVGFVLLLYIFLLLCLILLLAAAYQQAVALVADFPKRREQIASLATNLKQKLDDMRLPASTKLTISQFIEDGVTRMKDSANTFAKDHLKDYVISIFGSVAYFGVMSVVLPIITFSMMLEMNPMRARALMLVPPVYRRDVMEMAQKINEILGRYVRGQLIVCSLFGVMCTVAFSILGWKFGMAYSLVIGLCAGFLYLIPFVGLSVVVVAAAASAYFTSNAPVACTLIAVGCCIVFNLLLDYVVSPRVVGKGVGLHPLMVIFALLSGAELGGIPGMLLAVPFFASVRAVLVYLFPQLTAPIPTDPADFASLKFTKALPNGGSVSNTTTTKVVEEVAEAEASVAQEASVAPDSGTRVVELPKPEAPAPVKPVAYTPSGKPIPHHEEE